MSGTVISITERRLTQAGAQNVLVYPVAVAGNFEACGYIEIIAAAVLTATWAWADASGAQSIAVANGAFSVGTYQLPPLFVAAVAAGAIVLSVAINTANAALVSAALKAL